MDIKKAFTKRPKGLLLIIFMLLISIPFDIYDLIFKEGEYFIIELISILYFGLTAVGLWYKNELARRCYRCMVFTLTPYLMIPSSSAFMEPQLLKTAISSLKSSF